MSSTKTSDPARTADVLHSAAIHLLRRLRKTDEKAGLSAARLSVLSVLVFAGDKTLGELARLEQVKPPTITKLVQALEVDGFVTRKAITHDKRAAKIMATTKGRTQLIKAQQYRIRNLTELIKNLHQYEINILEKASLLMEELSTPSA